MFYKCHYCDKEKGKKTINCETDDFIRIKNKTTFENYHTECFKLKAIKSRKYKDSNIEEIIAKAKRDMADDVAEKISRDRFFEWIMNHYEDSLPSNYVLRVDSINKGEDNRKRVFGSITYDEFLEMYKKLVNYLAKQTYSMNFKNTHERMSYELAIVISQYKNYKKYKDSIANQEAEQKVVEAKLNESAKFTEVIEKARSDDKQEFHVSDIMNELF